jgi:hypothetical protein
VIGSKFAFREPDVGNAVAATAVYRRGRKAPISAATHEGAVLTFLGRLHIYNVHHVRKGGNMDVQLTRNFTMRITADLIAKLDILRKNQLDLPSQSEMIRRLVEAAYQQLKRDWNNGQASARSGIPD